MSEEDKIVYVDIDELGVDQCNIRQGIWDYDKEIINTVKTGGVRSPLLVRPIPPQEGKKYGIVCGSRRYNAAVEAGRSKIPCFIREMTDIEALEESLIENRQRVDTPRWTDIESVGKLNEASISVEELHEKLGISKSTIVKYIRIYGLPEEVKGLLREPYERTTKQKECLKLYQVREITRTLPVGHADLITELAHLPTEKQLDIAVFILNTPFETVRKIIDFKKAYPDKSANEIYNEIKSEYGIIQRTIRFEKLIYDGLSEACMKKQMHYDDLIIKILIDWLKKGGYLGKTPLTAPDINETHAININKKTLLGGGYQFLKKIGNREVYQRATGKGSGFIKAYLFKRNQAYLKLTAGEYDDPQKILEDEINRLQFFEARNIKTKILRKPRKWLKRKIG